MSQVQMKTVPIFAFCFPDFSQKKYGIHGMYVIYVCLYINEWMSTQGPYGFHRGAGSPKDALEVMKS